MSTEEMLLLAHTYYPKNIHPFDERYDISSEHQFLIKTILQNDKKLRNDYTKLLSKIKNDYNLFAFDITLFQRTDRCYSFVVRPLVNSEYAFTFHISLVSPYYISYKNFTKEINSIDDDKAYMNCVDFSDQPIKDSITTLTIKNEIKQLFQAEQFELADTSEIVHECAFDYIENINLFQAFFTNDFNNRVY